MKPIEPGDEVFVSEGSGYISGGEGSSDNYSGYFHPQCLNKMRRLQYLASVKLENERKRKWKKFWTILFAIIGGNILLSVIFLLYFLKR